MGIAISAPCSDSALGYSQSTRTQGWGSLKPDPDPGFPDPKGHSSHGIHGTHPFPDPGSEMGIASSTACSGYSQSPETMGWHLQGWAGTSRLDPRAPSCRKIPRMSQSRSIVHLWHETVLIKAHIDLLALKETRKEEQIQRDPPSSGPGEQIWL